MVAALHTAVTVRTPRRMLPATRVSGAGGGGGGGRWNWRLAENTWCVCGGHLELEVRREYIECVCVCGWEGGGALGIGG